MWPGLFLLNSGIGTTLTTEVTIAGGGRFELFVLFLFGITQVTEAAGGAVVELLLSKFIVDAGVMI